MKEPTTTDDKTLWDYLLSSEDPKIIEAGARLRDYRRALDLATPMAPIMENIFKFLVSVHEEGHPQVCQMVISMDVGGQDNSDTITLWAGPGLATPMARITELRNLNRLMAQQLEKVLSSQALSPKDVKVLLANYAKIQKENK